MRILWADDQRDVAKTLSLGFSAAKHKITFVEDGTKLLGLLRDRVFDVIVLDLAMPPGAWGGLWVLEKLREIGHRVPVIVLSGEGRQTETIKAIRLGARDFVTKEAASRELEDRLTAVLNALKSEIDKAILTSFPCPIALSYKRYLAAETPQSRMRAIFDIYEQALRLVSIVGLAEAAQIDIALPSQLITRLGRPSVGTWYEAAMTLWRHLPEGACLRMFWRALEESPIDEIISTRNDVAHGSEFGERKAADWLSAQDPVLRIWITRLAQKFPFRLFSVLSSAYDGTNLVHNAVALEGENSVLPKREVKTKGNLVLRHTYLNSAEEDTVSLHPLLLAEPGEGLNSWRVYLFDGWRTKPNTPLSGSEPLRYSELWTGDRMDHPHIVVRALPNSIRQRATV